MYDVDFVINKNLTNDNLDGNKCQPNISAQNSPARTVLLVEANGPWGPLPGVQDGSGLQFFQNGYRWYFGDGALTQNCDSVDNNGTNNGFTTGRPLNFIINGNTLNSNTFDSGWTGCPLYNNATQGLHTGGSNILFCDGHVKWMVGSMLGGGENAQAADCETNGKTSSPPGDKACTGVGWPAPGTSVMYDTQGGKAHYPVGATFSVE
jgi:prepilin-type processing-associated H-X9-DG protein